MFDGAVKTIVFNQHKQETGETLSFYKIDNDEKFIPQFLNALYKLRLQSVIIEGGAKLLQSFIDENVWDEARIICNRQLTIDNGLSAPVLKNNLQVEEQKIKTDIISFFRNKSNTNKLN